MLKKIMLATVVAAAAAFAQLNIGAHAGLDLNTLWDQGSDDASTSIGFNVGIGAKFSFPILPIALTPEVLVDMRNYGLYDSHVTQWNIDVPVLVRFTVIPVLYLEGGPFASFNLAMSAKDDDGDQDKVFEDKYQTKLFEFGLAFGVGTGILQFVDIDLRMNLGLTNLYDKVKSNGIEGHFQPIMSSMQFALGATYWF